MIVSDHVSDYTMVHMTHAIHSMHALCSIVWISQENLAGKIKKKAIVCVYGTASLINRIVSIKF